MLHSIPTMIEVGNPYTTLHIVFPLSYARQSCVICVCISGEADSAIHMINYV